ncbi:hypothetical protein [Burkholderia pseudomallei]|uniref:hypothetical protein n=1 Tax=Burkholderia pseudomallei TaxID=28450 RepID=UPI0005E41E76|nr:hypothetical protein [Burkholderia pseudomallei]MCW0102545.1 hypothetical protein [Burkholderia pseudomallei]CAJ4430408.1 Uncharacterised protein [Burkholderia pseudomallei]CAJ6176598.1 Uncharacterised protein [Burkholderia pseudomallei]CAJ6338199.1 Uncharacterised protein [Burkholderia pseudomallei]CAJ6389121.1 Uncharacterised protein [Burkholderia pseudomallei]
MRWLDRLHAKHPRTTTIAAILLAFVLLYIAREIDHTNSDLLRWQLAAVRTA